MDGPQGRMEREGESHSMPGFAKPLLPTAPGVGSEEYQG